MRTAGRYLERFHHRAGWLAILFLMLPILAWVWLAARDPVFSVFSGGVPRYVMSGKLFSERFDTIHAGSALDQPTIGKWLFWFTVMTASSLPYAAWVRRLSNRANGSAYLVYAACAVILGICLLCMLSWPLSWLIQYVASMGFTPRRVFGLLYAIAGGFLVIRFVFSAFNKPSEMTDCRTRDVSAGWHAAGVLAGVLSLLVVLVNWQTWSARYYCLLRIDHGRVAQACSELLRDSQFTNKVDRIQYLPGRNWSSLPPELRGLDLELISVQRRSVVLRKSREAIFVFQPNRTNSTVFELTFNGGPALCQLKGETTIAEPAAERHRR